MVRSKIYVLGGVALALLVALIIVLWIDHVGSQSDSNSAKLSAISLDRHEKLLLLAQTDYNSCLKDNERAAREDVKWKLLAALVRAGLPDKPGEPGYDYYRHQPEQLAEAKRQNASVVRVMLIPFPKIKCAQLPNVRNLSPTDRYSLIHDAPN